jgi:hypothetical protein
VPSSFGRVLLSNLNIQLETFTEKYLGLLTAVGRLTSEAFEFISDSARSKVNGWAEKILSFLGKEACQDPFDRLE